MSQPTNEGVLKFISEQQLAVPPAGSDYCMGYQFAMLIIKRFVQGKEPFEFNIAGLKVSVAQEND